MPHLERRWKQIRILITCIYLLVSWLLFTGSLSLVNLAAGVIFSLGVAVLSYRIFIQEEEVWVKELLPRIDLLIIYLSILLLKVYVASFQVAYQILSMDIRPGEIRVRTRLRSSLARTILANSITFTPGTITVDLDGEYLYVHCFKLRSTNVLLQGEIIKGSLERWLLRIFH